jgi:hypothetical protein
MAGALMQLVAYGAQDVYLTGNPQITFFKVVYRRHTNFAMESMQQTISGNNTLGGRGVCKLARNGDLVGACYFQTTLTHDQDELNNRAGFNLLSNVELRIGGQRIDRQSNRWMLVWTNLTNSTNANTLLDSMVSPDGGDLNVGDGTAGTLRGLQTGYGDAAQNLVVPLQFSFCRNPGLALPLIALQYHDVELVFTYNTGANIVNQNAPNGVVAAPGMAQTSLMVDYIFLDTEERKNFAQNPHEYLIETVQEQQQAVTAGANSLRLDFNHPVKELIWFGQQGNVATANGGTLRHDNFTNLTTSNGGNAQNTNMTNLMTNGVLRLNGQDRFDQQNASYFNFVQPYQYHSGVPLLGLNVYSFALKPEEHQPSGTCNFSRIDNASLNVTAAANCTATVLAHGYNVLRVASGMGGLAYSN